MTRILSALRANRTTPVQDGRVVNHRPKDAALHAEGFFAFAYERLAEPLAEVDTVVLEAKLDAESQPLADWIYGENPVAAAAQAGGGCQVFSGNGCRGEGGAGGVTAVSRREHCRGHFGEGCALPTTSYPHRLV
jgi:hypothetical protein